MSSNIIQTLEYPVSNIPPIVYSIEQSRVDSRENKNTQVKPASMTNDVSTFSSFDKFMNSDSSTVFVNNTGNETKRVGIQGNTAKYHVNTFPSVSTSSNNILKTIMDSYSKNTNINHPPKQDLETKPAKVPTTLDNSRKRVVKDTDDYIFHMYVGSLSIVGLLILFRILQKG